MKRHDQPKTFGCHHFADTCQLCEGIVQRWKAGRLARGEWDAEDGAIAAHEKKAVRTPSDRELLELAAKAAGIEYRYGYYVELDGRVKEWEPLTDDGDALRLAVRLHIDFKCYGTTVRTWVGDPVAQRVIASVEELCGPDQYEATRRAIVRAAAEIGRALVAEEQQPPVSNVL